MKDHIINAHVTNFLKDQANKQTRLMLEWQLPVMYAKLKYGNFGPISFKIHSLSHGQYNPMSTIHIYFPVLNHNWRRKLKVELQNSNAMNKRYAVRVEGKSNHWDYRGTPNSSIEVAYLWSRAILIDYWRRRKKKWKWDFKKSMSV